MLEHRIDRRARLLAEGIAARKALYMKMLRPPGSLAPGETQVTTDEGYAFWMAHRYDEIGKRLTSQMAPGKVAELDAWLAGEVQKRQNAGALL